MGNTLDACKRNSSCANNEQGDKEDIEARQLSESAKSEAAVNPPKNIISTHDSKGFASLPPKKLKKISFDSAAELGIDSPQKSPTKNGSLAAPVLEYINELREIDSRHNNPAESRRGGTSTSSPMRHLLDIPLSIGSWGGSGPCLTITSRIVKRKMPNGAEYEGDTDGQGQANGRGKYLSPNGDVYEGDFTAGKMSGTGTMIDTQGNSYSGGWKNGVRSGRGVERSANGDVYEGEYLEDKKHGYGTAFAYFRSILFFHWL
jgi:hypothetical protein